MSVWLNHGAVGLSCSLPLIDDGDPCHFGFLCLTLLNFLFCRTAWSSVALVMALLFSLCWSIRGDTSYPLSFVLEFWLPVTVTVTVIANITSSTLYFGFLCLTLLVAGSPKSKRNRHHCNCSDICEESDIRMLWLCCILDSLLVELRARV